MEQRRFVVWGSCIRICANAPYCSYCICAGRYQEAFPPSNGVRDPVSGLDNIYMPGGPYYNVNVPSATGLNSQDTECLPRF